MSGKTSFRISFMLLLLGVLASCSSADFRSPRHPDPIIKGEVTQEKAERALRMKLTRQIEFLNLLGRLKVQGHAQFIIATHSPILLALPGAQIFSFDFPNIQELAYTDTTHYRIYKQFFANRSEFLEDVGAEPLAVERRRFPRQTDVIDFRD